MDFLQFYSILYSQNGSTFKEMREKRKPEPISGKGNVENGLSAPKSPLHIYGLLML